MKIQFWGAAGTVTGSKYLITENDQKILIDAGIFQGAKKWRMKNWEEIPIKISQLLGIILTHAHLDHSGALPLITRKNYGGLIYSTPATFDLCKILLPDSGRIQEEDARLANLKHFSKHKEALPLYTEKDAKKSLEFFKPVNYYEEFEVGPFLLRFIPVGHILGASSILVTSKNTGKKILFSGDIGRYDDYVMTKPADFPKGETLDYLVMESTYGGRNHPDTSPMEDLKNALLPTLQRGGVAIIPAFAVARSQTIIYCLHQLIKENKLPDVPIFLDSPMSAAVTTLYLNHHKEHQLSVGTCRKMFQRVQYIESQEDSLKLLDRTGPMIIISASGMMTGGRVLHHVRKFAGNKKNLILLVGYQGEETRGERLVRGERELKIHGEYISINCEVNFISGLSAHADEKQLLRWFQGLPKENLKKVFLVHGDQKSSSELSQKITTSGVDIFIPQFSEQIDL
jgi:metallo-beta-lactamase family protein